MSFGDQRSDLAFSCLQEQTMMKARDWGPGLDRGQGLFAMAGVQTEAVADGTSRWHLEKMDFDDYMQIIHC